MSRRRHNTKSYAEPACKVVEPSRISKHFLLASDLQVRLTTSVWTVSRDPQLHDRGFLDHCVRGFRWVR